ALETGGQDLVVLGGLVALELDGHTGVRLLVDVEHRLPLRGGRRLPRPDREGDVVFAAGGGRGTAGHGEPCDEKACGEREADRTVTHEVPLGSESPRVSRAAAALLCDGRRFDHAPHSGQWLPR